MIKHNFNAGDIVMTVLSDSDDKMDALARGISRMSSVLEEMMKELDSQAEEGAPLIKSYLERSGPWLGESK